MSRRHVCTGRFLRKSLSPQHVAKKSDQTKLRRQNSVAEKIFHQKISCTHEAIFPCDASQGQLVAATTRTTCTQGVILSPRRVAATHRLVCFALFALLVIRAPEIFYSRFATM